MAKSESNGERRDGGGPSVEVFSDGSSLEHLDNGAVVVREHRASGVLALKEQPAPYNKPPPKPVPPEGNQ